MLLINPSRLWDRLKRLSLIGKTESGGITRLSFTHEEREATELVMSWMREVGLSVRQDAMGNVIGRKEGLNPLAPAVLVGSHLDSVYNGGNFDGPLGVLAGLEALQTLIENQVKTEHPIELIILKDEEGAHFSFGMLGSRALAGSLTMEDLEHHDGTGKSIAEAMREFGLKPEAYAEAARSKDTVKAYVELHIEQGKILESQGLSVGIVSGIAGPLWLKFIVTGEAGHAGTTPMGLRHDALVAASSMIQMIEVEAKRSGSTVGTVGQLQLFPGGINIIPERVEFTLDLRDIHEELRDSVEERIRAEAQRMSEERGVGLEIQLLQRIRPALCSESVQTSIQNAFKTLGFPVLSQASGAGHDGMQLQEICPIGMIFVRSKYGISHSPAEWSSMEDCRDGANALLHTLLQLTD